MIKKVLYTDGITTITRLSIDDIIALDKLHYEDDCISYGVYEVELLFRKNGKYVEGGVCTLTDSEKVKLLREHVETIIRPNYNVGVESGNIYSAFKYTDTNSLLQQYYRAIINEDFSNDVLYKFGKQLYSKCECSNSYSIYYNLIMSLKGVISDKCKEDDLNYIREKLGNEVKEDGKVRVYRGYNSKNSKKGVSYTLSEDVARFFANRWGDCGSVDIYEVDVKDIDFYIEMEKEVVTTKAKYIGGLI